MERSRREDGVEALRGQLELLESRDVNLRFGCAPAGDRGQVRSRLGGLDVQAARDQRHGQLAGAAADLEHMANAPAGERRVDERCRIAWTSPVIGLGHPVEGKRPLHHNEILTV